MVKHFQIVRWLGFVAFLVVLGCSGGEETADDTYTIAVIPKGTTHEFWKSIHAGAIKASREHGCEIIWKGPLKEDDREEQLQIVETFIASGVDAIVIAPLDDRSLVRPVQEAARQGIPTVVVDSDLQGDAHITFIATNNYRGGTIAAKRLGTLLNGTGDILVLRYQEGSASTMNREQGFLDTMAEEFPGINILSQNQYAGATSETAYIASENLLNRYGTVDGMFTPNESSTFGCLRALQDRRLTDEIIFVGFDSSEKLVEALAAGEIKGLVLQNPFEMGYTGVTKAVEYLNGEDIEEVIDTGVTLATPENMHEPDIQQLLSPDLSRYLDE